MTDSELGAAAQALAFLKQSSLDPERQTSKKRRYASPVKVSVEPASEPLLGPTSEPLLGPTSEPSQESSAKPKLAPEAATKPKLATNDVQSVASWHASLKHPGPIPLRRVPKVLTPLDEQFLHSLLKHEKELIQLANAYSLPRQFVEEGINEQFATICLDDPEQRQGLTELHGRLCGQVDAVQKMKQETLKTSNEVLVASKASDYLKSWCNMVQSMNSVPQLIEMSKFCVFLQRTVDQKLEIEGHLQVFERWQGCLGAFLTEVSPAGDNGEGENKKEIADGGGSVKKDA